MKDDYHEINYRLRFQLSDLTLFYVDLPICARQLTLKESMRLAENAGMSDISVPSGSRAVLVRGLPHELLTNSSDNNNNLIVYVESESPRFYINLDGTFEEYEKANFSAKTRSTLRRKIKKFREECDGNLEWKSYRTAEEMTEFYTNARTVSEKTYQEKLFQGGIPDDEAFVKQMNKDARLDQARAYLLFDAGQPVSYLYLRANDDVLTYDFLGYLPEYAKWSVGTVLQWLALQSLFEEKRFRLFDFTDGYGAHKKLFSTSSLDVANVFFFRRTLPNYVLVQAHRSINRFSSWSGDAAERWGLRKRIKRLIRFGWASQQ